MTEQQKTEREKLLDKIRALLSKTTESGCTEGEYLAALAKARALMDYLRGHRGRTAARQRGRRGAAERKYGH